MKKARKRTERSSTKEAAARRESAQVVSLRQEVPRSRAAPAPSEVATAPSGAGPGLVVGSVLGKIVDQTEEGRPLVQSRLWADPVEARALTSVSRAALESARLQGLDVLIAFDGEPARPIIIGVVAAPAAQPAEAVSGVVVEHDGERVRIEADRELVLRCGEATLVLTEDGKVLVQGRDIVSKATHRQRIKGGVVLIN